MNNYNPTRIRRGEEVSLDANPKILPDFGLGHLAGFYFDSIAYQLTEGRICERPDEGPYSVETLDQLSAIAKVVRPYSNPTGALKVIDRTLADCLKKRTRDEKIHSFSELARRMELRRNNGVSTPITHLSSIVEETLLQERREDHPHSEILSVRKNNIFFPEPSPSYENAVRALENQ
jgi:hypothetical protein